MTAELEPISLDEVREEMLELDCTADRLNYLIELGDNLAEVPADQCIEDNRVMGCQSAVWMIWHAEGDRLVFTATSDAPMVRGLIAIIIAAYSGKSAEEIVAFPIDSFFEEIRLKQFLTPMRSNGLHSIVQRARSIAQQVIDVKAVVSIQGEVLPLENVDSVGADANGSVPSTDQPRPQFAMMPSEAASRDRISIENCRRDFPILFRKHSSDKLYAYLDNTASSQRPNQVIELMDRVYKEHYSNVHRSGHILAAETTTELELARESVRRFINAKDVKEIIFTSGTTGSINLVARSWGDANLKPSDEIILSDMEHHSNIVPWQQLAKRTGAIIRWIPITADYKLDLVEFQKMLSRRTKLVAITAVSNVLGTINPIEEIVSAARRFGSLVLVDAAQSIPHGAVDVKKIDADFVAFSGHKMLAPTGVGILYGRRSLLESMQPFLGGGSMIQTVTHEGFTPAELPHRFEAGTGPIVESIAMRPAIEYLEAIGPENILKHERTLTELAHEKLLKIPGVKIYGPATHEKTGIVTFTVEGVHADSVGTYLNARGVAVRVGHHCAMPLHHKLGLNATVRASFYFYNIQEEVERFADAVKECQIRLLAR